MHEFQIVILINARAKMLHDQQCAVDYQTLTESLC